MDLKNLDLDKRTRIILLGLYAVIMFISIINEIDTISFILLFAVIPVAIYYFVLKIFPKKSDDKKDEREV